jgi:hypothetical protein
MMYELHLGLSVSTPEDDATLSTHLEEVAEALAAQELGNEALLDFSLGADLAARTVEIEVTVDAPSPEQAAAEGFSWIRAAIHATGASTPNWEAAPVAAGLVEFHLDRASTKPLIDA